MAAGWRASRRAAIRWTAVALAAPGAAAAGLQRRSDASEKNAAFMRRGLCCEVQVASLENPGSFVEAKLTGLHKKGLVAPGEWHVVTLYPPMGPRQIWDTIRYFTNFIRPAVPVKIWNAREAEAREGLSKSEFFQKHGFVLLERPTAMTAADWLASAPITLDSSHFTGIGMPKGVVTPVTRIYAKEVEAIARELMPDAKDVDCDPLCARRGPGTKNPNYSFGPHNDYGFLADDWPLAGEDFRRKFADVGTRGMMAVNFWRPVLPMSGPVVKTPLAVLDPSTVRFEDVVPTSIRWDEKPHHRMMMLAHDEEQRWYYYPNMTTDEVLIFKSFQHFKTQSGPVLNTCIHTAFNNPLAPANSEPRQSAEYRVRVWF